MHYFVFYMLCVSWHPHWHFWPLHFWISLYIVRNIFYIVVYACSLSYSRTIQMETLYTCKTYQNILWHCTYQLLLYKTKHHLLKTAIKNGLHIQLPSVTQYLVLPARFCSSAFEWLQAKIHLSNIVSNNSALTLVRISVNVTVTMTLFNFNNLCKRLFQHTCNP